MDFAGESAGIRELNSQDGFVRELARHRLTVLLVLFVAGVCLDAFYDVVLTLWIIGSCLGFLGWCLLRKRTIGAVCLFMITVAAMGGLRHHIGWRYFDKSELGFAAKDTAEPVCLAATIQDCPRHIHASEPSPLDTMPDEDTTRFRIRCDAVRNGRTWEVAGGMGQVVVLGHSSGLRAGDRVRMFGKLVRPSAAMNPDEFDYREYERAHRRLFRLSIPSPASIVLLKRASKFDVRWYPQWLRGKCQTILFRRLPQAQAELACAMLLGSRDYLSRSRREAFFYTGTVHLLAISGLHVGILASVFFVVLQRTNLCDDRIVLLSVSLLTLAYATITEGKPPVMRASILVWIICLARFYSRDGFALNSLSAAALVILAYNPAQLFQIGFHLSFLAVIALFWIAPRVVSNRKTDPLTKLIEKSRPKWERELRIFGRRSLYWCAASLSIWCLTLPISANGFHLISPIGLVLNVFVWFPLTIALFSGFGTLCFGWFPFLGGSLAWICCKSFDVLETIVAWALSVPGCYQWVAGPTKLTVVVFYVALSLVVFSTALRKYSIRWMIGVAIASLLLDWVQWRGISDELRCTFLSVGHGNCVVVEFPGDEVWLYDVGSIAGPNFVVDAVSQYLWRHRIARIDKLIVSHADVDHFNGVPELLNRFPVQEIVCAPTMLDVDESAVEVLAEAISKSRVPLRTVADGTELTASRLAGVRATALHPPAKRVPGSDNANSVVIEVAYQGKKILLTGDIEFAGLDRLIDVHRVDADVAMAPHHGSPRSEPKRFLTWCTPEIVVISAGQNRDYAAACRLYEVSRRVHAYHTARDGAVSVVVNKSGILTETVRGTTTDSAPAMDR